MTDDVEDLLVREGAAWRAAQLPPFTDVDPTTFDRRPRRRWQPLIAAAAVLAIAMAGGLIASQAAQTPAPAGASPGAVVRDGDRVTGQGVLYAAPGKPVRMCLTAHIFATNAIGDGPACQVGIPLRGVEPDRIPGRQERSGRIWGTAVITGVYRDGVVAVTALAPPPAPSAPSSSSTQDRIDCPAPAGAWPQDSVPDRAVDQLGQLVRDHPDRYALPFAHFPYAATGADVTAKAAVVMEVGTTGDVAEARRELSQVFPATHLCVTRVFWSQAGKAAATRALSTPAAAAVGIQAPIGERLDDTVEAELLILNQAASRFLAGIAGGHVLPRPMLTKSH